MDNLLKELKEREALLQELEELAEDLATPLFVVDPDEVRTAWNSARLNASIHLKRIIDRYKDEV